MSAVEHYDVVTEVVHEIANPSSGLDVCEEVPTLVTDVRISEIGGHVPLFHSDVVD